MASVESPGNSPTPLKQTLWFPEGLPEELSKHFEDPEIARVARANALRSFLSLPAEKDPLYKKYSHLANIDLASVNPRFRGKRVTNMEAGPSEITVLHDAGGTSMHLPAELVDKGLIAMDLPHIWNAKDVVLSQYLTEGNPLEEKFGAMNMAILTHGLYVEIPDRFPRPVRIREVSVLSEESQAMAVRRVIHAGKESSLFHSEELYTLGSKPEQKLYSSSTNISASNDSEVLSLTFHSPDNSTVGFYNRHLSALSNTHVYWLFSGMDGFRTTVRNVSSLDMSGAEVSDLEVFYGDREQSSTSNVRILHEASDTRGQSITRGVFKDSARGTFTGMMRIDPSVKKVFSYLSEHAMLLSRTARAETAPGMEILSSNDVKASHSSSVAPIDPEKIFYIESRGLDTQLATRFLVEGFLFTALSKSPLGGIEDSLHSLMDGRWSGEQLKWDGRGETGPLRPNGAKWLESGDVRMDEKLR